MSTSHNGEYKERKDQRSESYSQTRSVSSWSRADIGRHARACFEERDFRPWAPTTAAPILEEAVIWNKMV